LQGRYRTDSPRLSQPDAMAKTALKWASKPVEIHCDMGEAFGNWTMVRARRGWHRPRCER